LGDFAKKLQELQPNSQTSCKLYIPKKWVKKFIILLDYKMAFNLKYYKGITTSQELKNAVLPVLVPDGQIKGIRVTPEEQERFLKSPLVVITKNDDNRSDALYVPRELGTA